MKTLLIGLAGALFAVTSLNAQTTSTSTTVTTDGAVTTRETVTRSTGTLDQYAPGSTFIVKETAGPVAYSYGPNVVYATRAGTLLTPEQVQARIRVGVPVHVDYVPQGETRVIRRVVVDEDDDDDEE